MKIVQQIALSSNGSYQKDFRKSNYFKPLYKRSSDRLLLIVFYQQKVSKNEMIKLIDLSTNGNYR